MSKRQKTHQLVVTVTHDAPVTQAEAARLFRDVHMTRWIGVGYCGDIGRGDIDVAINAKIKSVKAYKP